MAAGPPHRPGAGIDDAKKPILAMVDTLGPAFLRLALNDAMTWNNSSGTGGPTASISTANELARPGNRGLESALMVVEALPKGHPGLSLADAIQLGGVVAVAAMGGPAMPFRTGRMDLKVITPDYRLPTYDTCCTQGPNSLLDAFQRMGLTVRQGIALCGVHPFGRFWSSPFAWERLWPTLERLTPDSPGGGSPRHAPQEPAHVSAFDVEIYRDILDGRDPMSKFLLQSPEARSVMEAYLANPTVWFSDYASAFTRLSEAPLRRRWSPLALQAAAAGAAAACAVALLGWKLYSGCRRG